MVTKLTNLFIMRVKRSKESPMIDNHVTVTQAADILKLKSTGRVRQLLLQGKLKGRHFGNIWMIEKSSVEAYATSRRKPGPKPLDK